MISGTNNPYAPRPSLRSTMPSAPVAAPVATPIPSSPATPPPSIPSNGPGVAGILDGIKSFFAAIGAFFVGMWNRLTGGNTSNVPAGLSPAEAAMATQYGLLATRENVQAFLAETQSYTQPTAEGFRTLGPGATDTAAVKQVQEALTRLGFPVTATGSYDAATQAAVKTFKAANGLQQSYRLADGRLAVNEYLEPQTFRKMIEKLSPPAAGAVPQPPASTTQPPPSPQPSPAPQTPPASTSGTVDTAAIATQYRLLNTPENVQTFLSEVRSYQTPDAQGYVVLGPGSTDQESIRAIQAALTQVGFPVSSTGSYDTATQQAVIAFKTREGLRQTYRSQDGNFAINEYLDRPSFAKLASMV